MGNTSFKIITPIYNGEKYIGKCIESILSQDYDDYEVIIIDDCSTDKTWEIINSYKSEKIRVIRRDQRMLLMPNLLLGASTICKSNEDVMVWLDGDDYLYCPDALSYLDVIYTPIYNEPVLATVGGFINLSEINKEIPKEEEPRVPEQYDSRIYRKLNWFESHTHLRTFKYRLWKNIKDNDLRAKSSCDTMKIGDYYPRTGDLAILYAILEMAGNRRTRLISKILCVYNNLSPINDSKSKIFLTRFITREIAHSEIYTEI